ncbi:hybrid sensor histidine kinase/response regulator transcription factor [Poritiphilus flavus]|uniref:histidine kinase n=1 Tax=Poritiphilus flavus TaxID=2697053 RepID=A0A6L9EF05_9FLAO|nr:tetratricopeptide repeat protein [Poritiphilus flavus]NAS13325.1 tetratricopeptide repeat protein [Poritiphilus flavus]
MGVELKIYFRSKVCSWMSKTIPGRYLALCLVLLSVPSSLLAQSSIDSLKTLLEQSATDTSRVSLLNELGEVYTYSSTDSALLYTREALTIAEDIDFADGVARSQAQLSRIFRFQGNYPEALDSGFEALMYYKNTDRKAETASVLTNLGGVYFRLQDYPKALDYYQESLQICQELRDEIGQASQFVGLGLVYENMFEYDKALDYYLKALTINRINDVPLNTAINLVNIGDLYLNINEFDKALPYFKESLEINRKIHNQQGVASVTRHLAQLYQKTGELDKSTEFASTSLEVARQIGRKVIVAEVSLILSENYASLRDYKKALEYSRMHTQYNDSLYDATRLRELSSLENKYEVQQKEQELKIQDQTIALLNRDSKIDRLWRNILAGGLLAIGVLGFVVYKFQRLKNRKNAQLLATQQTVTQKLQELDKAKSRFFANVSHEFRTPLTLIKGPIEQLAEHPKQQLSRENLSMIQRNTERLLELVNQLLDLSRLDAGNLKLEKTEADIFGFLRAVASSFDSHAAKRQISYKTQIPEFSLQTSFDKDKLEKVIYNLLSNAFKFSNSGSEVVLKANQSGDQLKILVEDSGRGIKPEQLPYIFDRFYRADDDTESQGTGIGLGLTKELIALMGGQISVQSEFGRGSVFNVELPLTPLGGEPLLDEIKKSKPPLIKSLPFPELQEMDGEDKPTVLLTEDHKDMRRYVSEVLSGSYRVLEAKDGSQGLKKALANSPDLIITDLMMPEMDGMQFCKLVKSNIITSHIPVIMLTAKSGTEHKIHGLETGADDYLTKPFEADELMARVKNLILQRKRLRESYANLKTHIHPKGITVNSIDENFLERVHKLLEIRYMDPDFGVPQFHKAMAMSRAQFHRKIRALCNETPGALLRNFRLKRAAQLLSQDADHISRIAYGVGFNSLSYFTKCFKDFYGVAPSLYQAEYPLNS